MALKDKIEKELLEAENELQDEYFRLDARRRKWTKAEESKRLYPSYTREGQSKMATSMILLIEAGIKEVAQKLQAIDQTLRPPRREREINHEQHLKELN